MLDTFTLPVPRGEAPAAEPVVSGWTPARRHAVEEYIGQVAPLLRLTDWTIVIDWSSLPPDDEAFATCTSVGPSRHCELRFSAAFLGLAARDQVQVILHELMHCKLFPLQNLVDAVTEECLSRSAQKVMSVASEQAVEYAVDDLADVLLPFMPLLQMPAN